VEEGGREGGRGESEEKGPNDVLRKENEKPGNKVLGGREGEPVEEEPEAERETPFP